MSDDQFDPSEESIPLTNRITKHARTPPKPAVVRSVSEDPTENETKKHSNKRNNSKKGRHPLRIKYQTVAWAVIVITTFLTAADRFTTNLWPLWVNSPGPFRDTWSVSAFISFSWASGRILIVSTNVAFMTQCRVFWNWFAEHGAPGWLDCGDIHQVNNDIHYYNAWVLVGLVNVVHCWSILLPWAAGVKLVVFDTWWRPNDPVTGKRMNFYANKTVSLSVNDVYRLVGQSLAFFILFPMSRYMLNRKWTISMFIHLVAAAIFTIDLVRMKSHPHCWVFNCPIILWWMCDRFYGIWYYRRYAPYVVQRLVLDDEYMVLYLRSKHKEKRELGDVYYLNSLETHSYHRAHPFTTFSNHTGKLKTSRVEKATDYHDDHHKFRMMSVSSRADFKRLIRADTLTGLETEFETDLWSDSELEAEQRRDPRSVPTSNWDTCAIMKIYQRDESWTKKIAYSDDDMLHTLRMWGPYRSEYRELTTDLRLGRPLVLIGTGAGACFLIDFQQWILANFNEKDTKGIRAPIEMFYSTRSIGLFQFVSDTMNSAAQTGKLKEWVKMNIHFTSNPNVEYAPNEAKALDARIGRSSFEEILEGCDRDAVVYFCGAPEVQSKVVALCTRLGLDMRLGHAFH